MLALLLRPELGMDDIKTLLNQLVPAFSNSGINTSALEHAVRRKVYSVLS